MGWVGLDGVPNGSIHLDHTLWVYRQGIYLVIYEIKICYEHSSVFSKFDVKLESWDLSFKNTSVIRLFEDHGKSKVFEKH